MNIVEAKRFTWIDIKNPTEEDLAWLASNYKLHPLVLKELLPHLDYPKVENFGEYLFVVLFYPFFDRENSQTIPFELDIIVSGSYIITSHYKDILPLKAIFDDCNLYNGEKACDEQTGEVLYRIIRQLLLACLPKLSHIKENIDKIEQVIYTKQYQKAVEQIANIQRDLIGFERVIEPQGFTLKNLAEKSKDFFNKDLVPYFNNLINLYNQVSSLLSANRKTLAALDSTNQSLLNTKTNQIIKVLTIVSVLVLPFTFLAELLSMNAQYLQILGKPSDFIFVYFLMLAMFLTIFAILKKKKWM